MKWGLGRFIYIHTLKRIFTTCCGSKIKKTLYQRNPQAFPQGVKKRTVKFVAINGVDNNPVNNFD